MDPYTIKLIERAKAHREALNAKLAEIPQPLPRKRRSPLREENAGPLPILGSVKEHVVDDDSPGKRQCLEVSSNDVEISKENFAQLQNNISSLTNSHLNTATKLADRNDVCIDKSDVPERNMVHSRAGRFAALAANIHNWEDELPDHPPNPFQPPTPKARPPLESNSTPPMSTSTISGLSSSQSIKTSTSDHSLSSNNGSSSVSASPKAKSLVAGAASPSAGTPKFKLPNIAAVKSDATSKNSNEPTVCLPSSIKQVVQKQHLQQTTPKKVVWDRAIVATLEAQGFVQSPSKSKLEYTFQQKSKMARGGRDLSDEDDDEHRDDQTESRAIDTATTAVTSAEMSKRLPTGVDKARSVKDLAKKFDRPGSGGDLAGSSERKDPTQLPLSARVALFEKNIVNASATKPFPKKIPTPTQKPPTLASIKDADNDHVESSVKSPLSTLEATPNTVSKNTFEMHKRLFEKVDKDWKSNEIAAKISEDRQKDLEVVLNRWSYNKKVIEEPTPENGGKAEYVPVSSTQSGQVLVEKSPSKDIPKPPPMPSSNSPRTTPNKPHFNHDHGDFGTKENGDEESSLDGSGEDYDDDRNSRGPAEEVDEYEEVEEEEEEEEEDNDLDEDGDDAGEEEFNDKSHGRNAYDDDYCKHENRAKNGYADSETEANDSDRQDNDSEGEREDMDSSILQVAFQRIQSTQSAYQQPHPAPALLQSSMPSMDRQPPSTHDFRSPRNEPSDEDGPLLHTVSFYRRQKEINKTPVRTVVRNEIDVNSPPTPDYEDSKRFHLISDEECRARVLDKIKELQEDANAQLIIMSQASQALNLCRSTAEFHGSAEQIEGERLLLISFQRRQASLNEIQRLKTESALGSASTLFPARKGSLTISEMGLTLKREFLAQTDSGKSGEFVHYFVCLVKHRGLVVATQMVSTLDNISMGAFHLPNLINLRELDHDFNILLEVYGLQTRRENIINRDRKTLGSRKDKSRSNLTPKKKLGKRDLKLASPVVQSPGGPSAICSTSFSLIGYTMINIKSMKRTNWTLDKVPFVSPLDGNMNMKVQCHTDHRVDEQGFLTMFEDVSGFGAWHRRWFHLDHRYLSYWKYPDDVKRKEPIGQIDLCQCVTSIVTLVPRDICARPHTLMLLTVRPPTKDDVATLVSQNYNTYTATKVLLSADTKEERVLWCRRFNDSLENLRMWNPNALKPIPSNST